MPLITAHASETSAPRSTYSVMGSFVQGLVLDGSLCQECDAMGPVVVAADFSVGVLGRVLGGASRLRPSLTAASLRSLPSASLRSLALLGGMRSREPGGRGAPWGPGGTPNYAKEQ